jgi:hypothetical protein
VPKQMERSHRPPRATLLAGFSSRRSPPCHAIGTRSEPI